MTPPRRRSGGLRLGLGVALGLIALVIAVAASHPWWLAHSLGAYLSKAAGREVHFDKVRLGLTGAFAPQAVFEGVRIANAPWADASRPFAVLGQAAFEFAWHRYKGRWLVTRMILRDGEVHLVRQADGRRNWRLRDPEDRGPGHFWFQALEPHRIALSFLHDGADLELRVRAGDLAGPLVNRVDFDGRWRGVAFKGGADTGPELTFFESGRWFALRGHAEVQGARLEVDGRAADLFRGVQIDAATIVSGNSLAGLRPVLGARPAETRPFRVEGRLVAADAVYHFKSVRARVGATDLAGKLSWSRRGERPSFDATLASDATDIADLLWLAGKGGSRTPPAPKAARPVEGSGSAVVASDRFAGARALDADIAFQAKRFRVAAVPLLQSLKLKARLDAGVLAVSDLDAGWGSGHSTGTIGLDLRQHPARADAQLETRGVRIESLFPAGDEKRRVTGVLRARSTLKAVGDDLETLRASLTGKVSAALSAGTIPSMLDAQMGLEVGKMVRSFLSGSEALPLPCAAVDAELGDGMARITNLVIDSANTRVTGSGVVDLRDGSIDMKLTPEPKRPGLFELKKSIRLLGRPPKLEKTLVDRLEPIKVTDCDARKP
ncbi:MAG: AsmA family protein [Caldimonas sp.]